MDHNVKFERLLGNIFLAVLAILLCGCNADPKTESHSKDMRELIEWIETDQFPPRLDSVWPCPLSTPEHIMEFVRANYDTDCQVRTAVAYYFLLYNSKLYDRGLLTVDGDETTLIYMLWEKEGNAGWVFAESPSCGAMRERIKNLQSTRFCLDKFLEGKGIELIEEVEQKLKDYYEEIGI